MKTLVGPLVAVILTLLVGCQENYARKELFARALSWHTWDGSRLEVLLAPSDLEMKPKAETPSLWFVSGASRPHKTALVIEGSKPLFWALKEGSEALKMEPIAVSLDLKGYSVLQIQVVENDFLVFVTRNRVWSPEETQPPLTVLKWSPGDPELSFIPLPSQIANPTKVLVDVSVREDSQILTWQTPKGPKSQTLWNPMTGQESDVLEFLKPPADPRSRKPFLRLLRHPLADLSWSPEGLLVRVSDQSFWTVLDLPPLPPNLKWTGGASLERGGVVSFISPTGGAGFLYIPYELFQFGQ